MSVEATRRTAIVNFMFSLTAAIGLVIAILGIGFDLIPGASPGLSLPQLMMIMGGLLLSLTTFPLRRPHYRSLAVKGLRKHLLAGVAIACLTLLALEVVLVVAGLPTYFPPDMPQKFLDPVPWWTCDEAGCHYVYDAMKAACENGELSDLRCVVNRQGFHDKQDFVVGDDFPERLRILMLGDSFAFGGSADLGKSYVELVEQHFPQAVVWNTGIPGAGTNQAIASFEVFAPLLQPQVTILGFYMNDFDDNMMPIDSYFMGVDSTGYQLSIRQYQIDLRGEVIKLDQQSDLYYRYHRVDPPASETHRIIGTTRLGTLALRATDAVRQMISKAEGVRVSRRVEVTREYLINLRDRAAASETQLLVLLIPKREDTMEPGLLYENALRLLEELGIPYLNPVDALDSDLDYSTPPNVHWSNAGHRKIGFILIDCMESFLTEGDVSRCEL